MPNSYVFQNATALRASIVSNTWSGLNLGVIMLCIAGFAILGTISLPIVRRYLKAFGYVGKGLLHIAEGGVLYFFGKGIYVAFSNLQDAEIITPDLLMTLGKWGAGFLILGFIGHLVGLKALGNFRTVLDEVQPQ